MSSKRMNIMFYSSSTGEQIIFPINPETIEMKFEKNIEKFDILGCGQINIMGNPNPMVIKLSHFLPEDDSIFGNTNSGIIYNDGLSGAIECGYSSLLAIDIFKKWALQKHIIRLVIDDDLNMESFIVSFSETLRESTASRPYILEISEYKSPCASSLSGLGLVTRKNTLQIPKTILMKANDTIYSIASKYGLDYKILAKNNGITDVNEELTGQKISTTGA
ncbi:MAG: LysM peptidoglycan-binding domain-containing protein [Candidatus Gastranaerophilales bacterium]|nr:LysM peptidoglycan-binding domain-containing protein [Candidatus Gastranaerophilales bacterium]